MITNRRILEQIRLLVYPPKLDFQKIETFAFEESNHLFTVYNLNR
jgi:hypothetical protein